MIVRFISDLSKSVIRSCSKFNMRGSTGSIHLIFHNISNNFRGFRNRKTKIDNDKQERSQNQNQEECEYIITIHSLRIDLKFTIKKDFKNITDRLANTHTETSKEETRILSTSDSTRRRISSLLKYNQQSFSSKFVKIRKK